jgi:hypothetical protein
MDSTTIDAWRGAEANQVCSADGHVLIGLQVSLLVFCGVLGCQSDAVSDSNTTLADSIMTLHARNHGTG